MIRKKSSFLTFCFSLLPGAGQMYMGFMKRGISLMSAFFLLIFFSTWLNLGPLMFAMPIIWFFAFFDTHNLRSMPDDEFYALEDDFILIPEFAKDKAKLLQTKYRNILAVVLIIIGFSVMWNNVYDMIEKFLPKEVQNLLWRIGHYFPQLTIGIAIIAFGLYLIAGKKKDLDSQDNISAPQYRPTEPQYKTAEPQYNRPAEPQYRPVEPQYKTAEPQDKTAEPQDKTAEPQDKTAEPQDKGGF